RGRDAGDAQRPRLTLDLPAQRVGLVRHLDALRGRRQVDIEVAVLHLEVVARHGRRDAGALLAGQTVEPPVVPGADNVVLVVDLPVAERPADVVAAARDRPEHTVLEGQGDPDVAGQDLPERFRFQVVDRAEAVPAWIAHG